MCLSLSMSNSSFVMPFRSFQYNKKNIYAHVCKGKTMAAGIKEIPMYRFHNTVKMKLRVQI